MQKEPPQIAANLDAFLGSLFSGPRTFDGYVIGPVSNRYAKGIRVWIRGETFVLNPHNVFCLESKQPDGKTRYFLGGRFKEGLTMRQEEELADRIRALAA